MDLSNFGKTIYELRKERGWTQSELAEKLNLSDKTVSKWERGSALPEITTIFELAKTFEVDYTYLIESGLNKKYQRCIEKNEKSKKSKIFNIIVSIIGLVMVILNIIDVINVDDILTILGIILIIDSLANLLNLKN